MRLERPVATETAARPAEAAAWQGRSGTGARGLRASDGAAVLPSAGPAIRVVSTATGGNAGVRWKVRDANASAPIVNRDAEVRAATELQLNDPQRDPFGDRATLRTSSDSAAVGPFTSADEPAESAAPPRSFPAPPASPPDEPSFEAPQAPARPPRTDSPAESDDPAAPPPRQLEEPLRTIPMGPPGNVPPKSLPASPPRKLESAEDSPAVPARPLTRPDATAPPNKAVEPPQPPNDENDTPLRNAAFCRRLYNERNCCSDENACNEHRAFVKSHPLSKISLDITPTCNLTSRQNGNQGQCGFPFEQSPSRVWRDRKGREIARGRVTALANLRVEVTDDDGNAVRIRVRDMGEDDICFLAAWCGVPSECRLDDVALAARNWTPITMTWKASGLCHKPLYFEEEQLERYGHTAGPFAQPVISGAHFFANIALLPYHMGIHPMNECQYALGYYRPGSCAPWMIPPFPLSARGALAETGAVLGGVFLIP